MSLKSCFSVFAFIAISVSAYAQNAKVILSFRIKESINQDPVVGAIVRITSPDDSSLSITRFSDEKGLVEAVVPIRIPLQAQINHAFYEDTIIEIGELNDNTFWGTVYLKPSSKQLPEVTIEAKGIITEFDKKEYIVTDRMRKQAVTTTDLLKQLPEIQYDPFRDKIMVQGKMKVMYLVNGIEKPLEYVKSISPKRILKIEIYRNPVGRYALEGYDAVINIVLRDDYIGFETSVSAFESMSTSQKYIPGKMPFNYESLNFAFIRYKTTVRFAFYSWRYDLWGKGYDSLLINNILIWSESPIGENWNNINKGWGYTMYTGLDWQPSTSHLITFDILATGPFSPDLSYGESAVSWLNTHFRTKDVSLSKSLEEKFVLTHRWQFGHSSKLQSQILVSMNSNSSAYTYEEFSVVNPLKIENSRRSEDLLAKLYSEWDGYVVRDRLHLLAGFLMTTTRYKETLTMAINELDDITANVTTNVKSFKPYVYLTWNLSKKLKFRTGTGSSYIVFSVNDSIRDKFTYLEPRIEVNWALSKVANLSASFNVDVKEPEGGDLLNTPVLSNRVFIGQGNRNLRPYQMYKAELTFDVFEGAFSLTPYYHWTNKGIETIWTSIGDSAIVSKPIQGVNSRKLGIKFSMPVPLYKENVLALVFGDYYVYSLSWDSLQNKGKIFKIWAVVLYTNYKRGLLAGVGLANQVVPYPTLQGFQSMTDGDMTDFAGAFVQKTLLNERLSLMVFYTFPLSFSSIDDVFFATASGENWRISNYYNMPFMKGIIGLNVSLNISKGRLIREREAPDDEEGKGFQFGF